MRTANPLQQYSRIRSLCSLKQLISDIVIFNIFHRMEANLLEMSQNLKSAIVNLDYKQGHTAALIQLMGCCATTNQYPNLAMKEPNEQVINSLQSQQGTTHEFKIAIICGSLRKNSTNAGLARAAYETKDTRFHFYWVDISRFPVFNEDIEAGGYPEEVEAARQLVGKCNGVLFAVAEYNFSVSSPLKNAYDWLSREDKNKFCPVTEKFGAMMSSAAAVGGLNAQTHLRQIVSFRKMQLLQPSKDAEILIKRFSGNFFDQHGNVTDQDIRKRIKLLLNEFYDFLKKNKK